MWVNSRNLTPHKLSNRLTVCLLGIFLRFLVEVFDFFIVIFTTTTKKKKKKKKTIRVSNGWNREQDRRGTVYKGYLQIIKVATSKEKVKIVTHYFLNLRQAGYPEKQETK